MKKTLVIIAILITISGCMKNSDVIFVEKVPLSIIPSLSLETTKALVGDTNIQFQQIGVHISNSAGTALYDNQSGNNNIKLSYGTSWDMASSVYMSSSLAKIFAYCPYSATAGDLTGTGATAARLLNIPVVQVQANQTDYLWAAQDKTTPTGSTNINNDNPSVTLKLGHSLTQISFVIWKENFTGAGLLSQIEIRDNSTSSNLVVNSTGTNDLKMKLADGTITGGQSSLSLTVTGVNSTISLTSDPETDTETLKNNVNAYLLLVPATIADKTKIQFSFTIDGNIYPATLEGTGSVSWLQGNQYIYKVKLSGTALAITGVTVTEWTRNYGGGIILQ